MFTVLAPSYVAIEAIKRAGTVGVKRIIIKKPGVSSFVFVQYGLDFYFPWQDL